MGRTEAVIKAQSLEGKTECKALSTDHVENSQLPQCWGESRPCYAGGGGHKD